MKLNKKGFAISTMLYGLIFITVTIFYMIISFISNRVNDNNNLVDEIRTQINNVA